MSTRPNPANRIDGGRVFKRSDATEIETKANAGTSGYTAASNYLKQLNDVLTATARNELASADIDAVGFEVEVDASAGPNPPFPGVTGLVGVSVVWFTNPDASVHTGPHVYLFARWANGAIQPIRKPDAPLKGCLFVVNDSGTAPSALTLEQWEFGLAWVGAGNQGTSGGSLLSGESVLLAPSIDDALLFSLYALPSVLFLFTFGTEFAFDPGEKRPFRITRSVYEHDQWLLERFEFLERPHGQTWTPPPHSFSKGGTVPTWARAAGHRRVALSLAMSTLNEEDQWIENDDPTKKFEENTKDSDANYVMLDTLEEYYRTTHAESQAFSHSVALLEAEDKYDNNKKKDIWVLAANDKNAWSAVFISSVAHQAGVGKKDGFAFSARHMSYIVLALKHELNGTKGGKFRLYEPSGFDPAVGDILCKNRKGGSRYSYSKLKTEFLTGSKPYSIKGKPGGKTHCDIVVRVETENKTTYLETVGGNTYDYRAETVDTAGRKRWKQTKNGDWVMVGEDNKVLGAGSTTKNEFEDTSEPKEELEDQTVWDPNPKTMVSKKDEVIGFMRYVPK